MKLSLVAALARNGVIGTETGLPWRLPADLKRFRKLTWGKPILMGRKTLETLGKPLDGREHIVLTRDPDYRAEGVHLVHSVEEALRCAEELLSQLGGDEAMVIGGEQVYRVFLPHVTRMYLTVVEGDFAGTAHFPDELPAGALWRRAHHEFHPADQRNPHPHHFLIVDRVVHPMGCPPVTLADLLRLASPRVAG
jgi:dihydrofolate reductase